MGEVAGSEARVRIVVGTGLRYERGECETNGWSLYVLLIVSLLLSSPPYSPPPPHLPAVPQVGQVACIRRIA